MDPVEPTPDPAAQALPSPPRRAGVRPWALALALAGLFGCGALVGVLGTLGSLRRETHHRLDPERWSATILERLDRELKLSPVQHETIAPLVRAGTDEAREARRRAAGEMWSILQRTHGRIAEQLTPEQRHTLDELVARRRRAARWWFHPPRVGHGRGDHPRTGETPSGPPAPQKSL